LARINFRDDEDRFTENGGVLRGREFRTSVERKKAPRIERIFGYLGLLRFPPHC